MNSRELEKNYLEKKEYFHNFIDNIKKNSPWDIFTIINPTLTKNPFASDFPIKFFGNILCDKNIFILLLTRVAKYYLKVSYYFFSYIAATILYKIFYKKRIKNNVRILIDVFALVDKNIKEGIFNEKYLEDLYSVFDEKKIGYSLLLRPYLALRNPFKLIKFFKILNKDKRDFILEYGFLSFFDFIKILRISFLYPLKTLRLLQRGNDSLGRLFNMCLIDDIKYVNYESFTRYILGSNLCKIKSIEKIYSWSEFQVIERSLNYAIRTKRLNIELIGLQLFVNYEIYFNTYCDDLDYEMQSSPHKILVNGVYYILNKNLIKYGIGISFRYKDVFNFYGVEREENILLLGAYSEEDTRYMLGGVKKLKNVIFKNHPAVNIQNLGQISENIFISNDDIYKLFENSKIAIGTASGACAEAVACGLSVIIMASQSNLTANPLIEIGRGQIWDIVYDAKDLENTINKLLEYRNKNQTEIKKISKWYRDNFFVEPTKENIMKVFEIE